MARGAGAGFSTYPADPEWELVLARRTICFLKQELERLTVKERALERQIEVQEVRLAALTADIGLLTASVVYTGSNATLKSLSIL